MSYLPLGVLVFCLAAVGCSSSDPDSSGSDMDTSSKEQTLCKKYGGTDAIGQVVQDDVIGAIAGDCRINAFFTALSEESFTRVHDCLTIQVQELFECEGVTYRGSKDSNGHTCRNMQNAHAGVSVSDADFDALIEDVVAGLQEAGVEQDDIETAAPALLGMRSDIVEVDNDKNNYSICDDEDGMGGASK